MRLMLVRKEKKIVAGCVVYQTEQLFVRRLYLFIDGDLDAHKDYIRFSLFARKLLG